MADFNINALGAFRNVDFGNADAIANLRRPTTTPRAPSSSSRSARPSASRA